MSFALTVLLGGSALIWFMIDIGKKEAQRKG